MVLISIFIMTTYLFLIGCFVFGFEKVTPFRLEDLPPKTKFSVIIPFRNEGQNLPELLDSIYQLGYPAHLFEIIFIDDDSEDESVDIITMFFANTQNDVKVIKNERHSNSPKKDAISTAITLAKYEWILTTDADCILPRYWLDSFDSFIQKTDSKCIVAPATYHKTDTFLQRFQLLDILSLQGATIGGFGIKKPFLCNGANFAYKKATFLELHGFKGNDGIASGDDVFLLEKITKAYPKAVSYLKCDQAIATTAPQPTWKSLLHQRLRWAAKAGAYNNWFSKLVGFIVLLANALIISLGLLTAIGAFDLKVFFYIALIKLNIDFLLIYKAAVFFDQKEALFSYPFAFIIYPFFSVYVAFISLFKKYTWKDRTFRK